MAALVAVQVVLNQVVALAEAALTLVAPAVLAMVVVVHLVMIALETTMLVPEVAEADTTAVVAVALTTVIEMLPQAVVDQTTLTVAWSLL